MKRAREAETPRGLIDAVCEAAQARRSAFIDTTSHQLGVQIAVALRAQRATREVLLLAPSALAAVIYGAASVESFLETPIVPRGAVLIISCFHLLHDSDFVKVDEALRHIAPKPFGGLTCIFIGRNGLNSTIQSALFRNKIVEFHYGFIDDAAVDGIAGARIASQPKNILPTLVLRSDSEAAAINKEALAALSTRSESFSVLAQEAIATSLTNDLFTVQVNEGELKVGAQVALLRDFGPLRAGARGVVIDFASHSLQRIDGVPDEDAFFAARDHPIVRFFCGLVLEVPYCRFRRDGCDDAWAVPLCLAWAAAHFPVPLDIVELTSYRNIGSCRSGGGLRIADSYAEAAHEDEHELAVAWPLRVLCVHEAQVEAKKAKEKAAAPPPPRAACAQPCSKDEFEAMFS